MKLGFNKRDNYLIFENNDDYSEMNKFGVINRKNKTKVIKGVGVDLEKFKVGIPKKNGKTNSNRKRKHQHKENSPVSNFFIFFLILSNGQVKRRIFDIVSQV